MTKRYRTPVYQPADYMPRILELLANGNTLRAICRLEGMPGYTTVYTWINNSKEYAEQFARARDLGEEAIAAECLEIADDSTADYTERVNSKTGETERVLDQEAVQRAKLRVWTRLQLLARWNPKKWAEAHSNTNTTTAAVMVQVVSGVPDQPAALPAPMVVDVTPVVDSHDVSDLLY